MKQAYEKVHLTYPYGYDLRKITVLPRCKKVTEHGHTIEYQLVHRDVLGFIPWTYWVNKDKIVWYDKPSVEYYVCSCKEEKKNEPSK